MAERPSGRTKHRPHKGPSTSKPATTTRRRPVNVSANDTHYIKYDNIAINAIFPPPTSHRSGQRLRGRSSWLFLKCRDTTGRCRGACTAGLTDNRKRARDRIPRLRTQARSQTFPILLHPQYGRVSLVARQRIATGNLAQ